MVLNAQMHNRRAEGSVQKPVFNGKRQPVHKKLQGKDQGAGG